MRDLEGRKVVVVGMAKSGVSAVEFLLERGAKPIAVDNRPADKLGAAAGRLQEMHVELLPQTAEVLASGSLVVLSPGVPLDLPELAEARARNIPVTGDLELIAGFLQGRVIGITGSNGKTTTTSMIGHILKSCGIRCQVGGNIGTPPAAMVNNSEPAQWNVLELSSFQLETIERFQAYIGVCLNVTPDHLDRHHTFEIYAAAKRRLFETLPAGGHAVLNADDEICRAYARKTSAHVVWFSRKLPQPAGVWIDNDTIFYQGERLMRTGEFPLRGVHNLENAMAAAAACRLAGAPLDGIAPALASFPGVEHRLEFVREVQGVKYYNDSKATNVDAAEKAIDAFDAGLWIILGGKDKGSDYTPLAPKLRTKAKGILLIGAAAPVIERDLGTGMPISNCGTLGNAVEEASRRSRPGEVVVLAPACASFDQFENYEHRGTVFKTLVAAI